MWEMTERAWNGWQAYTKDGKLAALAIAAVVYLLLVFRLKGPRGRLVLYTGIMIVACICPVTAVILMKYQTAFYDYPFIWSVVPVTAVIAMAGTIFVTEQWRSGKGWRALGYNTILTLALVAILFLCGSMGKVGVNAVEAEKDRARSEAVLGQVRQLSGGEGVLWAPADILEYARLDGEIQLLYGRNMWEPALNAYSYDTYSEEEKELYLWMEQLDDWDVEVSVNEVEKYVQKGSEAGAEVILLPAELSKWLPDSESEELLLERLRACEDREVVALEEYYLLMQR